MSILRVILGDQLSSEISALADFDPGRDTVGMMEMAEAFSDVGHHKQKLVLVLSAMRHFADALRLRGIAVDYVHLDAGQVSTNLDLARAEDVSDRYIGRMLKLAYLAPAVLEKLLLQRCPLAVSIKDLAAVADLPWAEQIAAAFGRPEAW